MNMPERESKKRWDAANSRVYTFKLMNKTDQDVIDFLEGKNKRNIILAAIREYINNHNMEEN